MVRSMMSFTDLPLYFWGYALLTAIHLLNRVPSKSVPSMPYEIWFGKKPSLGYLKTCRCPAYIKRQMVDKLEDRSVIVYFIGYPKESMGYYFYFLQNHNVIVSRNAIFLKKQFIQDGGNGRLIELEKKSLKSNELQTISNQLILSQQMLYLLHFRSLVGSPILLKDTWICLQRI